MEEPALIAELAGQIARGERGLIEDAEIERHLDAVTVSSPMSIGDAARAVGMLPTTIRYYEDAGLLSTPPLFANRSRICRSPWRSPSTNSTT